MRIYTSYWKYLFLLTWPPCIAGILNIGGWISLPGAEDSGTLGTVHIGLCSTLYPIRQTSVLSSLVLPVISVPSLHTSLPYSPSSYYSSIPVPSTPSSASCPALIPRISRSGCSHHRLDRHSPVFLFSSRHKFMIL